MSQVVFISIFCYYVIFVRRINIFVGKKAKISSFFMSIFFESRFYSGLRFGSRMSLDIDILE